jgi:toxin ParE1/3/4
VLELRWKVMARRDLLKIIEFIANDNPDAADNLLDEIELKANALRERAELYRAGRKAGTREMVVHPNYFVVYRIKPKEIEILRVKHVAQQYP